MAKLTRKSYQRKAMVVGATAFAGIALMATGFAAWVISSSATKNVPGGVQVGTISEKSITFGEITIKALDEGDTRNYFSFEPTKEDKSGRVRCDGENWENLSLKVKGTYSPASYVNKFSLGLRMGTVNPADNKFTVGTDDETRMEKAQTDEYIVLPECWAGGTAASTKADGVSVDTNGAGASASGFNITVEGDVATFEYTISFAWGEHFKGTKGETQQNLNPSEYYDSAEGLAAYPNEEYKTDLIKFYEGMTGQTYSKDHSETDPFKTLNFAVIVKADTTGSAAA